MAEHTDVYAAVANGLYREELSPQFAHVPWREDYELEHFQKAYEATAARTDNFNQTSVDDVVRTLLHEPHSLLVFRTIIGYTPNELAVAVTEVREQAGQRRIGQARIKSIEAGSTPAGTEAQACAKAICDLMSGDMWAATTAELRSKLSKPDTAMGWASVRRLASAGVPYEVFLHQRHYGGAFRQLLDATSSVRGDILEEPVEALMREHGIPHIRTGAHNQHEIADRFGLTVRPAPDFVVFREVGKLEAMIECKQANDGGTARDKAARYRSLRAEGTRVGGVPVVAVLDGLGWGRVRDALGPVVRDTDGRTFTLSTLPQLITVRPFSDLAGLV